MALMLEEKIRLIERAMGEDARLAGAGLAPHPAIPASLGARLRNNAAFHALGHAAGAGASQAELEGLLSRMAPGGFAFRGACNQFLWGLDAAFTQQSGGAALPGVAIARVGELIRTRLVQCGHQAYAGAVLTATGAPTVAVAGKGTYRGSLEVRGSSSGLDAINVIDIEDYVRGVVAKESPASWPIEALKAQAVAARSYALSSSGHGSFDVFDDTRSQAYGGVGAETAKTDQAVSATHLQVVLYKGKVAQTFFFSTSGGHTENNEFSSLGFGQPAIPYLRGVDDPYEADAGSPYEQWKRKYSVGRISGALHGIGLRGKLRNVVVTQRGASPRIVHANLIGSGGTTTVNGPQLASALGLPDTWAFFKKK
jgi:SpoIID/LytB domain protein